MSDIVPISENQGTVLEEMADFKIGMMETFQGLMDQSVRQNVAIFVDYDNVYHGLMQTHRHDPDHADPKKNIFLRLWEMYGNNNIRTFRAYADFEQIRAQLTNLQKKRIQIRHVYANGKKDDRRKNSSDIEMCIDAIESTYKDEKISCYVFVTADSDMIPIMSRMMYKGKRVELFYLESSASQHLKENIHHYAHAVYEIKKFLEIEDHVFELAEHIVSSLKEVQKWHDKNIGNAFFLGRTMLRKNIFDSHPITSDHASLLIEHFFQNELIEEKPLNGKPCVFLTCKGEILVQEQQAVENKVIEEQKSALKESASAIDENNEGTKSKEH